MRLPGKAQKLQRQDREDTGHGVENDATEKGQQQRLPPGEATLRRQPSGGVGAYLEGALGAVLAAQRQNAVEGRRRGSRGGGLFQHDFETVGPTVRPGFGPVVDQRTVIRKKHPGRIAQPLKGPFRNQQTVIMGAGDKAGLERRREW